METILTLLLVAHVAGGMTGLISGAFNIANRKGGKYHRLIGKIYVGGMFTATISGVLLAYLKENSFLFLIGVFSFYLAFTGFRTLSHKKVNEEGVFKPIDYVVAIITAIFAVIMIVQGFGFTNHGGLSLNPVLLIFGCVSLVYGGGDLLIFKGIRKIKNPKHHWFFNHIIRMMASYISAVTAFLVVNIAFLPNLLIWIGPSVIGSIIISFFVRRYRVKFGLLA